MLFRSEFINELQSYVSHLNNTNSESNPVDSKSATTIFIDRIKNSLKNVHSEAYKKLVGDSNEGKPVDLKSDTVTSSLIEGYIEQSLTHTVEKKREKKEIEDEEAEKAELAEMDEMLDFDDEKHHTGSASSKLLKIARAMTVEALSRC